MNRKKSGFFVKLAIFAVAVFAVITIIRLQFTYNEYLGERDQLKADISNLEDTVDKLQNEADAEVDDNYIVDKAKEKLNLRLPEEIIFYNDLYN